MGPQACRQIGGYLALKRPVDRRLPSQGARGPDGLRKPRPRSCFSRCPLSQAAPSPGASQPTKLLFLGLKAFCPPSSVLG